MFFFLAILSSRPRSTFIAPVARAPPSQALRTMLPDKPRASIADATKPRLRTSPSRDKTLVAQAIPPKHCGQCCQTCQSRGLTACICCKTRLRSSPLRTCGWRLVPVQRQSDFVCDFHKCSLGFRLGFGLVFRFCLRTPGVSHIIFPHLFLPLLVL